MSEFVQNISFGEIGDISVIDTIMLSFISTSSVVSRPPQVNLCVSPRRRPAHACAAAPYGAGTVSAPLLTKHGTPLIHIVFVSPQIHWNTGNIARTCVGLGATLHLIHPLGFSLSDKHLRRAGLDYWPLVKLEQHESWKSFAEGRMKELGGKRLFFTKFGDVGMVDLEWGVQPEPVVMVFGSEVDGFTSIEDWLETDGRDETKVALPMVDERIRCFNLSTTASMVSFNEVTCVLQ